MDDDLIDYEPCSYCGAEIPADMVRCPKCGQFTDGAGPVKPPGQAWSAKRIAVVMVALVAVAAFLLTMFGGC